MGEEMGIYDRCEYWNEDSLNIVRKNIDFKNYSLGNSINFQYSGSHHFVDEHIIISYDYYRKIYIIWNAFNYKDNFNCRNKLSLGAKGENFIRNKSATDLQNEIIPVYKKRNSFKDEVVYVVGENALLDFCRNYKEYVFASEIYNAESDEQAKELVRKYIQVFRKQRDPNFRNRVLKHYNYTCIVCGCKEINILEAAHIIPVSKGGSDDSSNGYCLCANHHLLFDVGKLEIDAERGTFHCKNTSEVHSLWYNEAEKRNFKLFLPNDMEEK